MKFKLSQLCRCLEPSGRPYGEPAAGLGLDRLEPRVLFSAASALGSLAHLEDTHTSAVEASLLDGASAADQDQQDEQARLHLPADLPDAFSVSAAYQGSTYTLQLEKRSVFGENTRFFVDDGSGVLTQIDPGVERSYRGIVAENADYTVTAILTEQGLVATINRPGSPGLTIEPISMSGASAGDAPVMHRIAAVDAGHDHDRDHDHADQPHTFDAHGQIAATPTPIVTSPIAPADAPPAAPPAAATLPPSRVMSVYEYEVGVEIGSAAFLNNYSGNLGFAQSVAQGIPSNLESRFLHSAGIKFRLGTVIIRTTAGSDPFTVSNGNHSAGLSAFRGYWNNLQANEGIAPTHDLAVYHVRASPSGLAYVNSVGTSNRYALSASNGATSWADGTLAHEFGHSWNLPHVGDVGSMFYESKPRSNGNAAGGSDQFVSIMHGSGTHNIGRLATDEANRVYNARQSKLGAGDLVTNPGSIKPFGHRDSVIATGGPITIDVVANDFDANNDVLNAELRDTVSQQGGTISLSVGTGPGGRDQIIYTPPAGANGTDFFHYNVVDSTGQRDWGAVYIDNQGPTTVDLNQVKYLYDLGTPTSVVFTGSSETYERVSEATFGDLGFTSNGPNPVESRDRGSISGVNNLNRDHIRMRSPGAFHHKLASGVYDILFTIGDAIENSNPIRFTAEGAAQLTTASHSPATFTNYTMEDIDVVDGELNIDIVNLGFSANITRIIITRVGDADVEVDLNQTSYNYDFGPIGSPVQSGWTGITPATSGDIYWSGAAVNALDRNPGGGVNNINRDFVVGSGSSTLHHALADGVWRITMNMGDADLARDLMGLQVEGDFISGVITSPAGQYSYVGENGGSATPNSFTVAVSDGTLDITFMDFGGFDDSWVATRLSLTRVGDLPLGPASIAGRHVFYDGSVFDQLSDDDAIATDKSALLPGQSAGFVNYTSYSQGLNGVMVDIAGLHDAGSLSVSDFGFKVGNDNNPGSWATAAAPSGFSVRPGEGVNGSDRVVLTWSNNTIQQLWLEITVAANAVTGLPSEDVFYFGNAIAESGNAPASDAGVNATDLLGVRDNPTGSATVTNPYDFNRNGMVDLSDGLFVLMHTTNQSTALQLISLPQALDANVLAMLQLADLDKMRNAASVMGQPTDDDADKDGDAIGSLSLYDQLKPDASPFA